ncbi:sushi, von Willebrand factor type A, EGF and pentraxin domain-containing protein 1-like [Anguilla rostrata]|uniref:sushi, von Willebrand factor type A, EGF and pentraxin domain-containing protein 1-like n=1 Tax=Anguilla rostrata TaxID=7938 RepID=UPI0030D5FE15
MFNFEDFSRHLLRLWVMALLGLALATRHSHGKSCSAPPDVLNGQWIGDSLLVGAKMILKCNTGYTVGGTISTMQCEDGGWNMKAFVCEAVKCPLPEQILNGKFSPDVDRDYLSYQESVLYTCDKSYTLSGESELRCTENGTLNAEPPECKRVSCSQPEVKFGRQVEGRPPYVHKSFIVYKCDEGYQMKGSSKIVCEDNVWSPKPPVCEKNCSQPEVKFGRQVEGRPPYVHKSFIVYKCDEGYQMKGSSKIVCEDKVWSPKPPVCEKRKSCSAPPDVLNGQWIGDSLLVDATMTLKCNTGYTVGGKISTMQCKDDGWNMKGFVCKGDTSGTGSSRTEVYSALAQRVVMALLIPVGLHLSL